MNKGESLREAVSRTKCAFPIPGARIPAAFAAVFSRTDETVVSGSVWISARRADGADIANAWANAIDEMRFLVIFEKVSSI